MGYGCCPSSSRKYEEAERRQLTVNAVDGLLQFTDHLGSNDSCGAWRELGGVGGKCSPYGKEAALHTEQQCCILSMGCRYGLIGYRLNEVGQQQAKLGIQLIHGAIGLQAEVGLGDTCTTNQ